MAAAANPARQVNLRAVNFGFLERARKTRFSVPKITFIVTPPFAAGLDKEAIPCATCSTNARIRASWPKFQNSTALVGSEAIVPPIEADGRRSWRLGQSSRFLPTRQVSLELAKLFALLGSEPLLTPRL
jgi:hypothetical protein